MGDSQVLVNRRPSSWFARRLRGHFDAELEAFYFKGVDPEIVPQETCRRIFEVHSPPGLRFFSRAHWRETGARTADSQSLYERKHSRRYFRWQVDACGYTPRDTPETEIWILDAISTLDLEEMVAHELRHCWQRTQ